MYVLHLLGAKDRAQLEAGKIIHKAFSLNWNGDPELMRDRFRSVLPDGVEKSIYYDLKKSCIFKCAC